MFIPVSIGDQESMVNINHIVLVRPHVDDNSLTVLHMDRLIVGKESLTIHMSYDDFIELFREALRK